MRLLFCAFSLLQDTLRQLTGLENDPSTILTACLVQRDLPNSAYVRLSGRTGPHVEAIGAGCGSVNWVDAAPSVLLIPFSSRGE